MSWWTRVPRAHGKEQIKVSQDDRGFSSGKLGCLLKSGPHTSDGGWSFTEETLFARQTTGGMQTFSPPTYPFDFINNPSPVSFWKKYLKKEWKKKRKEREGRKERKEGKKEPASGQRRSWRHGRGGMGDLRKGQTGNTRCSVSSPPLTPGTSWASTSVFLLLLCWILSVWDELYHYKTRRMLAVKYIDQHKYIDLHKFANLNQPLSSCAPCLSLLTHASHFPALLCAQGGLCVLGQWASLLTGF